MAKENAALLAWNRGLLSKLGLARVDLKRAALAAEVMTNWMPRVLGSMMLRPGLQYLGGSKSNGKAIGIPFVFSSTDTASLEMTDSLMRVRVAEALIARPAVTTTITNGTFAGSLTGWTDSSEGGADTTDTGNKLNLISNNGYNAAIIEQQVTCAGGNIGVIHALRIVVERGPVLFRCGSTSGGDDYIEETTLKTGTHSLAFTPAGDFYVRFFARYIAPRLVTSIAIEAAGTLELPTPWGEDDLPLIRWDQSADVIFLSCDGFQQRRIERRDNNSWSIVLYEPADGPFMKDNITTVRMTAGAQSGATTLAASSPFFRATQVGGLFRITSSKQKVVFALDGTDQYSPSIRIVGVGTNSRSFSYVRAGTWVGTLTLQRSLDEKKTWATLDSTTGNGTSTVDDSLANQIAYYRLGFVGSNYTSGTANVTLTCGSGNVTGIVRITGYTSPILVNVDVLEFLGGVDATDDWAEGAWSDYQGWPTALSLYEGRLWSAGRSRIWGSVSDAFEGFDDTIVGDSAPIDRSIGSGPVDNVNWLLPLLRLILGTPGAEISARSSSFDEPLTVTNFNLKSPSTQGSALIPAIKVDDMGFFVEKSGTDLYQIAPAQNAFDYATTWASLYVPDLMNVGIVRVFAQRRPDTRIHCILSDGTVAIMVFDGVENVTCWLTFETDGEVEDGFVLPDTVEDRVYYWVKRNVGGVDVRYLEAWAQEDDCHGGTLNLQADSYTTFSQAAANTITVGAHLEGQNVIVWADGRDLSPDDDAGGQKTYLVTGGVVTLDSGVTAAQGVVGLGYTAQYKSAKLAYGAQMGTALAQKKKINMLALILANTMLSGITYGQDFDHLDHLSRDVDGEIVDDQTVYEDFDHEAFTLDGTWTTDARLCLEARAPRPVTVLAAIVDVETHEKG